MPQDQFSKLYPNELFRKKNLRGKFVCSPLSWNRCKGKKCPFQICYLLRKGDTHYTFSDRSILEHSHEFGNHMKKIDGIDVVNYEGDLTADENDLMNTLSHTRLSLARIATTMEALFTGQLFTAALINRVKIKRLNLSYGSDRHGLP